MAGGRYVAQDLQEPLSIIAGQILLYIFIALWTVLPGRRQASTEKGSDKARIRQHVFAWLLSHPCPIVHRLATSLVTH